MAPSATEPLPISSHIKDFVIQRKDNLPLPLAARIRLEAAGIDLSNGYPERPAKPLFLDDATEIRNVDRPHIDAGFRADKSKSALLGAAKEVIHLTKHIGTEIVELQLKDLTDQQRDELALLIAERSVVFFRDQDITPQQQKALGEHFGEVEIHPQVPHVPGVPGVTIIWPTLQATERKASFRQPGASGYSAYSKLSPEFCKIIDGKYAIYTSAHTYLDRNNPEAGPKHIERIHPIVRVHPATGWKSLFVNRAMTKQILGLDKAESDVILNYLYHVYETNVDIQVRFKWIPRTSALWDNRITIHNASWNYEGSEPRHGTGVTSLAEKPYFDPDALTGRQALGLDDD
ncbi:putative alpha-ketoglutarate-dependent sulfonate dioxygenase [Hyaloscypha hepaticicola]|uniref:Putative alpha-ketoglutarate-dependent sulfonate dioxygenase n=1 Tax=Hyaloscypha hepaticicola TaxID=2082293 RepID=A0A2J6PID9_9HELO|nr:putative alpha-ketoglutarate-dependent sulfonate dioxygenase [Hyaloscypha hepaticicola]